MGVLDKILNFMKLDPDDDYDDDDFFDDDDEIDDYPPKRKSFGSSDSVFKRSKSNDDDLDDDDDFSPRTTKKSRFGGSKVTPMPQTGSKMSIVVITPSNFDESREVVETLLEMRSIILNVEGLDFDIAQRILDFVSGGALAVNGNVQFISSHIILITPRSVSISGDIKELASNMAYNNDPSFSRPRY